MPSDFLIYGANGFLGQVIARLAVKQGLRPTLAGRNEPAIRALATELNLDHSIFGVDEPTKIDAALADIPVILNCAGPFSRTAEPIADACIRTTTHYLDITGEIPVFEALAARDSDATSARVMLLPGVGFDVMPTDCLALHLKRLLPSATHLTLAFNIDGPAPMPPGTSVTVLEMIPAGIKVRRDGVVQPAPAEFMEQRFDFGQGPRNARRLSWGDVFTAYHTTGIPNIQTYGAFPRMLALKMRSTDFIRAPLRRAWFRSIVQKLIPTGPTADQRAATKTHVWGRVEDGEGRSATARLHGPEGGVTWTSHAALVSIREALAGHAPAGYQTPGSAYGPDIVLQCPGVTREDLPGTTPAPSSQNAKDA
jgi:short subunit dehydrogenase-like uncharacterized protein